MSLREIRCPMCKGTLWIDLSSGKVVDHKSADHKTSSLDDFLKKSKDRGWEDKMKKAKQDEAKRRAEIEAKFKKAAEDPDSIKGGDYENPFQWD